MPSGRDMYINPGMGQSDRIEQMVRLIATSPLVAQSISQHSVKEELEQLRAEVKEWFCSNCNTVYPGLPGGHGPGSIVCRRCGASTGPRRFMENIQLRRKLAEAEARVKELEERGTVMQSAFNPSGSAERQRQEEITQVKMRRGNTMKETASNLLNASKVVQEAYESVLAITGDDSHQWCRDVREANVLLLKTAKVVTDQAFEDAMEDANRKEDS